MGRRGGKPATNRLSYVSPIALHYLRNRNIVKFVFGIRNPEKSFSLADLI
jgi:hypothetical protein